jgi:gamma-glutamyl:cysteine ligase YbdK (ATP-grasp superfamily)
MIMNREAFKQLFKYDSDKAGYVGVERESFVCLTPKHIVPESKVILEKLKGFKVDKKYPWGCITHTASPDAFGFELSACQIESRIGPCTLDKLQEQLTVNRLLLKRAAYICDLSIADIEIAPADTPLDVYPDPTGRYQKITQNMPRDVLLAACRVAGTHVHVGMRDHESALRTYNYLIRHTNELCEMGNGSFGERLAIYKQMAPDYEPKPYESWDEYYQYAVEKGFDTDPRKCWTLIRVSVHGTIEFRMFGATESIARIVSWANRCHELCQMAMAGA